MHGEDGLDFDDVYSRYLDMPLSDSVKRRQYQRKNMLTKSRCTVIFLYLLLLILMQVLLVYALYEVYFLGQFNPVRCHIESDSVLIGVDIVEYNANELSNSWITSNFSVLDRHYTLKKEYISIDRINSIIIDDSVEDNIDVNELIIPVEFIVSIGDLVTDNMFETYESTTCFQRSSKDKLYLEPTVVYTVMSNCLVLIIVLDIIMLVIAIMFVKHVMKEDKGKNIKHELETNENNKCWLLTPFCCLLSTIMYCNFDGCLSNRKRKTRFELRNLNDTMDI